MFTSEHELIEAAKSLSSWVTEILPPLAVLSECDSIARKNANVHKTELAITESGHSIDAYKFGNGKRHIFLYGFPDPGEAVGGMTILSLLRGLLRDNSDLVSLNLTWHFIPCLNFDDQPNEGIKLEHIFRNPKIREVDWCVDNPRIETTAILNYAETLRPVFIYPLHDEYHSGEATPAYMMVSEPIDSNLCQIARNCLKTLGFHIKKSYPHPKMGEAFDTMTRYQNYSNSTFSRFEKYGLVGMCEVSQQPKISTWQLVAAQLSIGMIFLQAALEKEKK